MVAVAVAGTRAALALALAVGVVYSKVRRRRPSECLHVADLATFRPTPYSKHVTGAPRRGHGDPARRGRHAYPVKRRKEGDWWGQPALDSKVRR